MDLFVLLNGYIDDSLGIGIWREKAVGVEFELVGSAEGPNFLHHGFEDLPNEVHFLVSESTQDEFVEDPSGLSL